MTDGSTFLVDEENYEKALTRKWCGSGNNHAYPITTTRPYITAANFLFGEPPAGHVWDHVDRNPRNNTATNIRPATRSQNNHNRKKFASNSSPYKGITRNKRKWVAQIRVNRENFYLGSFDTAEEAARVYDEAARKVFGEFARLNFP
jgi:hypothetical protein